MGSSLRRSSAGGSKTLGSVGKVSSREAELLGTVANLKAALEKAMACSTPNTRHMQVSAPDVNRRGIGLLPESFVGRMAGS
jgi:hypothetical protein